MTQDPASLLARAPLLSAQEERELGARSIAGDVEARNALIEANVRLAIRIAQVFVGRGLALEDLIQEATIGLATAAEKFDPARGCRFSTYAGWWIRQQVSRALEEQSRTIRVPGHMVQKLREIRRADRSLRAELGRDPTIAEIAAEAGISIDRAVDLMPRSHEPRSLSDLIGIHGDELVTILPGSDTPADEQVARAEVYEALRSVLDEMPEREREILELRFGLHDDEQLTLSEIGERYELTRERIRQIEQIALSRIRILFSSRMQHGPRKSSRRRRRPVVVTMPPSMTARIEQTSSLRPLDRIVGQCPACGRELVRREGCRSVTFHPCPPRADGRKRATMAPSAAPSARSRC